MSRPLARAMLIRPRAAMAGHPGIAAPELSTLRAEMQPLRASTAQAAATSYRLAGYLSPPLRMFSINQVSPCHAGPALAISTLSRAALHVSVGVPEAALYMDSAFMPMFLPLVVAVHLSAPNAFAKQMPTA